MALPLASSTHSPSPFSYADWDGFTCFNGRLSVESLRESFVIEQNFGIQDSQYLKSLYRPIGTFLHGLQESNHHSVFGIRATCFEHVRTLIAKFVKFEAGDVGDPIKYTVRDPEKTSISIPLSTPDGLTSTYDVFDWPSALGYIFMAAIPPTGTANILHDYYIPLQVVYAEVLNRSFIFNQNFVKIDEQKRAMVPMTSLLLRVQRLNTPETFDLRTFGTVILSGNVESNQSDKHKRKTVRKEIRLLTQKALCLLLDPGRRPLFGVEALETALSELYKGCQTVMLKKLNLAAIQAIDPGLVPEAAQLLDELSRILGGCGNRMRELLKAISDPKDFNLALPRLGIQLLKSVSPHFFQFCLAICKDLGAEILLDEQKTKTLSAIVWTWLNGTDPGLHKDLISAHQSALAKLRPSDERYKNIGHCAETVGFIHFSQGKENDLRGVAVAPAGVVNQENLNILWLQQQRPNTPPFQAARRLFKLPCDDCKQIVSSRGQRYQADDEQGYNACIRNYPYTGRLISLWSDEDLSDFPGMDRSDMLGSTSVGSTSADTSEGKGPADTSRGKGPADTTKDKGPADPTKGKAPTGTSKGEAPVDTSKGKLVGDSSKGKTPASALSLRPKEKQQRKSGSSKK